MESSVHFRRHRKYLGMLEKLAQSTEPVAGARIAAMLVIKNSIIAIGTNINKTHPFAARFCKNPEAISLHAETNVINQAVRLLGEEDLQNSKSVLYICRMKFENPHSPKMIWGNCCPCSGCMDAITQHGIREVVFTTDEDKFGSKEFIHSKVARVSMG